MTNKDCTMPMNLFYTKKDGIKMIIKMFTIEFVLGFPDFWQIYRYSKQNEDHFSSVKMK